MKKSMLISMIAVAAITTSSYAGGGVVPVVIPVEPVPPAQELSPVYIGVGLIWGQYANGCLKECKYEDVTYGAMVRAGYDFNQYFGIEARLLATFWEADELGGQELQHIGIFAKPMYPMGEDFNMYGLLGYGWTETTTGGNGNLPTVDDSGFSAGLGLEYDLSDQEDDREEDTIYDRGFDGQSDQELGWGLFVDYQRLLIKSDVPDMDVISAGVTYDF